MIRIGIDTGGTYTDAVVIDTEGPRVLAKAKALTTKGDLSRGIANALGSLPEDVLAQAEHAAISTTLATNACVEGKGGRAKLIIVGTSDEVLRRVNAQEKFGIPYEDVLTLDFVGSYDGQEVTIPDWEALYRENPVFFEEAESFGIASLYALNNGAVVEKSGAAFLREKFGKIVVEATRVAAEPNVIGRGATALLNARLVPVISEFLEAIDSVFASRGLSIPVSIVRSDGTLMSEELARVRPVETILSGPAASVTGAQALAGESESLIVDIGGTTSDISIVHEGEPNRTSGIYIGGWKTQVGGVSIDTIALGGDTVVRLTKNSKLELGTRRVTPLCIAAKLWPSIKEDLQRYLATAPIDLYARYEFLYLVRKPTNEAGLKGHEKKLIELLQDGPLITYDERIMLLGIKPGRLEDEGIVMRCGMTMTDAMHLKGDFDEFDVEASRLGAQCLLKSYRGKEAAQDDSQIEALADEIYDLARYRLFNQIVSAFAQDTYWPDRPASLDDQMKSLTRNVWSRRRSADAAPFGMSFECSALLVGVGAPTHVFLGEAASALNARSIVPEHAEVANAVGAAVSHVRVDTQVRVHPLRKSDGVTYGYQVRGIDKSEHFDNIDDALAAARIQARSEAEAEALRRGASGDQECVVSENRFIYASTGTQDMLREWVISARIG